MKDMKDELIEVQGAQADPHWAMPQDFKVGGSELGKVGSMPGMKDALADFGDNTRCNEDSGMGESGAGTPTGGDWGAASKSKAFKVMTNTGEGGEAPMAMKIPFSVDLASGMVMPNVEDVRGCEAGCSK